jgi:hypothetical protein
MARKSGNNQKMTDTAQSNWATVLTFECPICGNDTFYEVWEGAIANRHVSGLDAHNGPMIEKISADIDDAVFLGFCCSKCHRQLRKPDGTIVCCDRELVTYLENQPGNCFKGEEYRRSLMMKGPRQLCAYCEQPCTHYSYERLGPYQGLIA